MFFLKSHTSSPRPGRFSFTLWFFVVALALFGTTNAQVCGNGVVEMGEACDDGNTLDGDYCSSNCTMITGFCGDGILQSNELCDPLLHGCCNATTCNSTLPIGYECRPANGTCDIPETCQGNITCPADQLANSTTVCRESAGGCDVVEYCPGNSTQCPPDQVLANGTLCGDVPGQCNAGQFCDGVNGTCPADVLFNSTVPCAADGLNCTVDACDAMGQCVTVNNTCQCMSDLECVAAQFCFSVACVDGFCEDTLMDGFCFIQGLCLSDGFQDPFNPCQLCNSTADPLDWSPKPLGALCDTGNPEGLCSGQDVCNGNGTCVDVFLSNQTVCRAADAMALGCDLAENCTGVSDFCPADAFRNSSYQCAAPSGPCGKGRFCSDAQAQCVAEQFYGAEMECRPSNGTCDQPEFCNMLSAQCPPDLFYPSNVKCRDSQGECDPQENCPGDGPDCPPDEIYGGGVPCGGMLGDCVEPRFCNGVDVNCTDPVVFRPPTYQCRAPDPMALGCDLGANCTGTNETCPLSAQLNSTYQCAAPTGPCSDGRHCSDSYPPMCMPEQFKNSSVQCRGVLPGDLCDVVDFCPGDGASCPDLKRPNGFVCRAATHPICNPFEICNGLSKKCPTDQFAPDGTPCPDGVFCNGDETCMAGACMPAPMNRTCDDSNPCTLDSCDEPTQSCVNQFLPSIGQTCYSGPNGTEFVGACKPGTLYCLGNGTVLCMDEVVPAPSENCLTGVDDNCNGVVNEGCDGKACVDDSDCAAFVPSYCQTYRCDNYTNRCLYPPAPGFCLIKHQCFNESEVNPINPCEQCQPAVDQVWWTANDSLVIDDNDVCNGVEVCHYGWPSYSAAPLHCKPSFYTPCANYSCHPTLGCQVEKYNQSVTCDSGYECATQEVCMDGLCQCTSVYLPDDGLSDGAIVAIAVGSVAIAAVLFALLCFFFLRRVSGMPVIIANPRGRFQPDYRPRGERLGVIE